MTILFKFNKTLTDPIKHELQYKSGCRYWYWSFEIKKYYIGFFENVMFDSNKSKPVGGFCYIAWNTKLSLWGKDEDYYDGVTMKRICFGRLQLHWGVT